MSAFCAAKCHRSGCPHRRPLNALFWVGLAQSTSARLASARFGVPDTDMRSQDEEKRPLLLLRACGHFYQSKQNPDITFLPSGVNDSPKERTTKAAFSCWCRRSPVAVVPSYWSPISAMWSNTEPFRSELAWLYLLKKGKKKLLRLSCCSLCYKSTDFKENDDAFVLSVWCSWRSKLNQLIRGRGIMRRFVAAIYIVCFPSAILKYCCGFVCVCVCDCWLCMMDDNYLSH